MMKPLALVFAAALVITGCVYDRYEHDDPSEQNDLEDVSLSEDLQPIFDQSCLGGGCHDQGAVIPYLEADVAYESLWDEDQVDPDDPEGSILYDRMVDESRPMPPGGLLPDRDAELVRAWIEQGAEDN